MQFSIQFNNIFLIGIIFCLRQHYAEATPSLHSGSCKSSRVSDGFCRSLNDCSTLNTDQKKDEVLFRELKCDSNLQSLICCPINEIFPPPAKTFQQSWHCGHMILKNREISNLFGGEPTITNEFPWMAILLYKEADEGKMCGGTLITDQFVLTAAHCVDKKLLSGVRLSESSHSRRIDIDVLNIVVHPDYQASGSYPNDIALLHLATTVTDFNPICLPQFNDKTIYDGLRMNIAGWGKTETFVKSLRLLKAEVPVWSKKKCEDFFTSNHLQLNEGQICAGNSSGSCSGDSGGPLMQTNSDGGIHQIGIISMGWNCRPEENRPTVLTKVIAYIDWIIQHIR